MRDAGGKSTLLEPGRGAVWLQADLWGGPVNGVLLKVMENRFLFSSQGSPVSQKPKAWVPVPAWRLIGCVPWAQTTPFCWASVFSSAQFSCSVMSDSLQPRGLQHARPLCLSPTSGVHPNLCPSSRWCHPAISSSVFPFSSHLQSFPASESYPVSQLFTWGGQSIGVSALASKRVIGEHMFLATM